MKPKILVVDDEPDALEVLGFKLKEAGFTPIFAKDGARAITAAVLSPIFPFSSVFWSAANKAGAICIPTTKSPTPNIPSLFISSIFCSPARRKHSNDAKTFPTNRFLAVPAFETR